MKTKRNLLLLLIDISIIAVSFIVTYLLLNYGVITSIVYPFVSVSLLFALYILYSNIFGVYKSIWRYAESFDFVKLIISVLFCYFTFIAFDFLFIKNSSFPQLDIYSCITSTLALIMSRIGYLMLVKRDRYKKHNYDLKNALIIGAGYTGKLILSELLVSKSIYNPIGLIDDDITMIGRSIDNVPILGCTDDIPNTCKVKNIDTIIFAIPSCDEYNKKRILNLCMQTDKKIKIIPFISNIIQNVELLSQMRNVKIEDLLGRDVIDIDNKNSRIFLENKICMVTGGGGSIGSELCRQIAFFKPKKLLIVDIYENTAYDIEQELKFKYKDKINLNVEIVSITDYNKMEDIFKQYNVDMVFHAAAHKHVPLMENNPEEAVKNNIIGTMNIAKLSDKYNVKKFIMISTDKAVNPTNIMGATKRICEMIVYNYAKISKNTEFASVRFGNVLGSNGSVIPLFKKQIEKGGPVSVTDPEIIRYFMTITEAVSLVIKAGAIAKGGEIFVLDMGKPVKIVELAENLIKLSGFVPHKDIKIIFTGLRPGEKLFEELLLEDEGLKKTESDKIFVGSQINFDNTIFQECLKKLLYVANNNDKKEVINCLKEILPNFDHKINVKK